MSIPFFAKIPGEIWINLALVRFVEVLPGSIPRIRVIWDKNTSDFLENEQALGVLKALEDFDYIDTQRATFDLANFSTEEQ